VKWNLRRASNLEAYFCIFAFSNHERFCRYADDNTIFQAPLLHPRLQRRIFLFRFHPPLIPHPSSSHHNPYHRPSLHHLLCSPPVLRHHHPRLPLVTDYHTKQHPSMVQTLPIASPNDLLRTPPRTHHKNYPAGTMKIGERLDTVAVTPFINFMTIFAAHRDLNVPTLHPHVFSHSSANIILQKSHYVPCLRHLRRVPPRSSASSCSKIGPTTVFFPADARRNWPKR
jgi:hypothetical protein